MPIPADLRGTRAIVTGGSSGLGAAVADRLAALDSEVAVLDRSPTDAHRWFEVDLSDTRAAEKMTEAAISELGGLDAVITCAGIDACGALADVPGETWDRVVAVNLLGTAAVVRAALPALTATHGRVVTVASTLGHRAVGDATAYCASKFGVVGFTRALGAETAGRLGVTLLVPGGMATPFFDGRPEQYRPPEDADLNPPERVADCVAFVLTQAPGCEIRELVVTPATDSSWP